METAKDLKTSRQPYMYMGHIHNFVTSKRSGYDIRYPRLAAYFLIYEQYVVVIESSSRILLRIVLPREKTTIAKSFRINEQDLQVLREESTAQNLTVNTLVNQLITRYCQFGRFLRRMHFMTLSQRTFGELIEELSDEGMIKAGQNAGSTAPKTFMTAIDGKIDVKGVVKLIHWQSTYSNLYEYTEKNEGEHSTITLMHELGRKWSLFLAEYMKAAFACAGLQPKCDITDRYVSFTI